MRNLFHGFGRTDLLPVVATGGALEEAATRVGDIGSVAFLLCFVALFGSSSNCGEMIRR